MSSKPSGGLAHPTRNQALTPQVISLVAGRDPCIRNFNLSPRLPTPGAVLFVPQKKNAAQEVGSPGGAHRPAAPRQGHTAEPVPTERTPKPPRSLTGCGRQPPASICETHVTLGPRAPSRGPTHSCEAVSTAADAQKNAAQDWR